jgi:hypothetical protein
VEVFILAFLSRHARAAKPSMGIESNQQRAVKREKRLEYQMEPTAVPFRENRERKD